MISVNRLDSGQAFYIAEAGIERGIRAVRDNVSAAAQTADPSADGYCGRFCLDGYGAAGSSGSNYERALFYGGTDLSSATNATVTNRYCRLNASASAYVQAYDFQQRYNYNHTSIPIQAMEIGMRARKNSSGGTSPEIQLQYSMDGGWAWTDAGSAITLNSNLWSAPVFVDMPVTPSWDDLMSGAGTDFRIRAYRTNGGNRTAYIDYLCIRVTVRVDAVTEPWYTTFKNADGTAAALNLALGSGVLETAPVDDEQGKVHLNYASQSLLRYLLVACGIADATANTLATSIVSYRGSSWFDSVEEL